MRAAVIYSPVPKWFVLAYLDRADEQRTPSREIISRSKTIEFIESMPCVDGMIDQTVLITFLELEAARIRASERIRHN